MFNPKRKSGSYVDKCSSKVQSTGSRAAPCFLAANPSGRKQKENWNAAVPKSMVPEPAASASPWQTRKCSGCPRRRHQQSRNRAKLVLTGPASAVSQPLPQTNHRSSERWAEWVPFLKSNFLNQVTFIQIRDTLKTQNVRMSTAKSKFSQVSLGTINVSSIFLALLSFFSIYIQWAIPPLLLPKCLIPISPMKIYTPKYPDICPLFQICSNHWYYWYSTHPYSPKHLTPPPLSILRHSHLRLTPSLGHSLPRCSSVPPATVSRAIEDSNLSASQPLAEYLSVASTYRSNLFRPSSLSHHPSTILEANITPLNGLHFVLLSNLSP